ncbi:hypothetical protein EH223_12090 [candidate division KSB1 bacterium]|nr:MAG: hypothetical protein EH223_12090 [candidate division KSB1 bacterium]
MKSERPTLYALFAILGLLLGGIILLVVLGLTQWAVTVIFGFFISFAYIIFSYMTMRHAFHKSSSIFYRALFGGMAIRFIFFLLSLFFVFRFTRLPIAGFVLSFILFYVIFQFFEARIVLNEIGKSKDK